MKFKKEMLIMWIVNVFLFGLLIFGAATLVLNWQELSMSGKIMRGIMIALPAALFVIRFEIVPEEFRIVTEVLGDFYKVKGPGLIWNPILVKKNEGGTVSISELSVDVFAGEDKIDFSKGGWAILEDSRIYVRVLGGEKKGEKKIRESIYKLMYDITDWRSAVREASETTLREYFNSKKADWIIENNISNWLNKLREEYDGDFDKDLEKWGLEPKRLTISNFDWSPEVMEGREKVYSAERNRDEAKINAKRAEYEAKKEAQELGGWVRNIKKMLQEEGYSEREAKEAAQELAMYKIGAESGSITDLKGVKNASGIEGLIARFLQNNNKKRE